MSSNMKHQTWVNKSSDSEENNLLCRFASVWHKQLRAGFARTTDAHTHTYPHTPDAGCAATTSHNLVFQLFRCSLNIFSLEEKRQQHLELQVSSRINLAKCFLFSANEYEKIKINNELILLEIIIVHVAKSWNNFFLCATDLRYCTETLKNTAMSHFIAPGSFIRIDENEHCSLV